ncbi:MAG TPA: class I SAM-dependent methyltransferase [Oligoflexia bacterium]|nr:class I SAM-dependent methyltransferase [Oligoflexia bacterium]HMR25195.1 class I SAM-dependent methyltransferase [Oligoflexia bacterium]
MNLCLICKSNNTRQVFASRVSVTSCSKPIEKKVDVFYCEVCDYVFSPSQQIDPDFYEKEYDLLMQDGQSEFVVFNQGQAKTLFDSVLDFLFEHIDPKNIQRAKKILEVGTGKGLLLKRLQEKLTVKHSEFKVYAVEPNKKSEPFLKDNLKDANISISLLEDAPFFKEDFDLVLSHGVLEHVGDPVHFLQSVHACMRDETLLYIGVPNFDLNPTDIITYDHLSKFTPLSINNLFKKCGLEVVANNVEEKKLFMFFLLKKSQANSKIEEQASDVKSQSLQSVKKVEQMISHFQSAYTLAQETHKPFVFYGAGNIGLFSLKKYNIPVSQVAGIYDDNPTFWNSKRYNITVRNPIELNQEPEGTVIYISANPLYVPEIKNKIQQKHGKKFRVFPRE